MDKKGEKCRICDVFHIHCAKPAPQSLLSPLNFDKFRPFFVLPLSFFHKTIDGYSSTAAGLATGKHQAYVGGTLAANPLSCLPIYTAAFSSVRRLTRRCCPKPAPKQKQNGAKPAPFCFCLLPSSISKYSTTNDISLTESSRYIRKIKWLL